MDKENSQEKHFFCLQRAQNITLLFKTFLEMIEDLSVEHSLNIKQLKTELPKKYHPIVDQSNCFTPEKLKYMRKKILDHGNECLRRDEKELENFSVEFIFNKKD
jgi:hypothetical protein